jgi:tetratricopeptide (TPR) repeat protein
MTDSKEEQKIISKRPISIVLVSLLGALFALIILVISFTAVDFIDFLYSLLMILLFFCIPLILIFLSLLFLNLKKKNKKRAIGFTIASGVCILVVVLSLLGISLFKEPFQRAEDLFTSKQYEKAAIYYEKVIEHSDNQDQATSAKLRIEYIKNQIDKAKLYEGNGDLYFDNNLFSYALKEYRKAYEVYPFLIGIKGKIKQADYNLKIMKNEEDKSEFVLLSENLKLSYTLEFPQFLGRTSISEPLLAEFENIKVEKGKFFLSDNEIKISGQIKGKPEIGNYVKSEEGLFVFLSAFIIDGKGNVVWSQDGYIEGSTPYIKTGETKKFSLINDCNGNVNTNDTLVVTAYLKKSIILQPVAKETSSANAIADKNIFALYRSEIGFINNKQ